jgi:hypothetical protein
MPRVPTYDGPQVREAALPDVRLDPRAYQGRNQHLAGVVNLAGAGGDAYEKVQQRNDNEAAFKAEATLTADWMQHDAELRKRYRGSNVDGYQDEVDKWWSDAPGKYTANLSPQAQKAAARSLTAKQLQASAGALSYYTGEKERATVGAAEATKSTTIQMALDDGTPAAVNTARKAVQDINAREAARRGSTPDELTAANLKDLTLLHASMVSRLIQQDPARAQAYFDANSKEIEAGVSERLRERLTVSTAANDGDLKAEAIWKAGGPKRDGDPVELDKMEAALRDAFPNDHARRTAAIQGLRERAAAFNAAEKERTVKSTNDAYNVFLQTKSVAAMKKSPAFGALPPVEQGRLADAVADRQHMLWVRGIEDKNRIESLRAKEAFGSFLQYSDPARLSTFSRDGVIALRPYLGNQLTEHLVSKWDSMQTKEGRLQANIDTQDFNTVADELGLKPYDPHKNEDAKRQLGTLQFRIEQLIDQEQSKRKAPMPRQEKMDLVRREMATTVSKSTWFGFGSEQVPVITLDPATTERIKVPTGDEAQIRQGLSVMYQRTGSDYYAPTRANIMREYLKGRSPAGGLVSTTKVKD